jgi:serine/threonine protein kinase
VTRSVAPVPSLSPCAQGGFAKCFKFTMLPEQTKIVAGKVVEKESIKDDRALAKVRTRFPTPAQSRGRFVLRRLIVMPPFPPRRAQLQAEIEIHRSLRHRYIVGFDTCFEDRRNVYIMLEMCTNQVRREGQTTSPAVPLPRQRARPTHLRHPHAAVSERRMRLHCLPRAGRVGDSPCGPHSA